MIMVTVSIVALFAFAVLAIDGAILMATRTQLHNAADAAALVNLKKEYLQTLRANADLPEDQREGK